MTFCHGLVVTQVPLDWTFEALVILATTSLLFMFLSKPRFEFSLRDRKGEILFVCIMVLPFFFFALAEPLTAWDARSIWFSRGKLLFFANGLHYLPYNLASLNFMAKDYPLFMSSLAATLMTPIHWWNEYFPKIILWIWMAQIIFAFFDFCRKPLSIAIWVSIYFYFCGEYMWNGYMDAYVAFFGLFGLTYLMNHVQTKDPLDLFAGASSLLVSAQIKNEGPVLSLLIFLIFFLWIFRKRISLTVSWVRLGTFTVLLGLPILAFWVTKKIWKIGNYLSEGFSWERTLHRATNLDDISTLLKGILLPDRFRYTFTFLLFALVYTYFIRKISVGAEIKKIGLVGIVATAYIFVLLVVFLITPLNLKDHVAYADRVSFPIYFFMIFIALWLLAPPTENRPAKLP